MCTNPVSISVKGYDGETHPIIVSCGKCFECLSRKSKEWSFRIMNECSLYNDNCFVTLTYNNENNPVTLVKRDYQLFLKRLRKHIAPTKIRYFMCGEYGKKHLRPHYHMIIFNWIPDDLQHLKFDGKNELFRSKTLETLWNIGFVSVGRVTQQSAKYCAKYLQKLQKIPGDLLPPFVSMSNRYGIGHDVVDSNMLKTNKLYVNGQYIPLPRYYKIVLSRDLGFVDEVDVINKRGFDRAMDIVVDNDDLNRRRKKVKDILQKSLTISKKCGKHKI